MADDWAYERDSVGSIESASVQIKKKQHLSRKERMGQEILDYVGGVECLQEFIGVYLKDTGLWGRMLQDSDNTMEILKIPVRRAVYRAKTERTKIQSYIQGWLNDTVQDDLESLPLSFILRDGAVIHLSFLDETAEWQEEFGSLLMAVIHGFNAEQCSGEFEEDAGVEGRPVTDGESVDSEAAEHEFHDVEALLAWDGMDHSIEAGSKRAVVPRRAHPKSGMKRMEGLGKSDDHAMFVWGVCDPGGDSVIPEHDIEPMV
ncbi:hypothetical protein K439DRAFT_1620246 [Ramaria rubella]|nr:hypothetical protein K439DRAFT_1620246 [Ramaria rubella]